MKILIIAPKNKTVYNFRGDLIKDMIRRGHEVIVTGPNRDFYDEVMSLGVSEFCEVPVVKDNTNPFGDFQYLKNLKTCIKRIAPDLVFSYTIKPVIYGSLAASACGVKRIYAMITGLGRVYSADSAKAKLVRALTNILYRRALKKCDRVIFQNPDDIQRLADARCLDKSKAVIVNGSGVNMTRFRKTPYPNETVFLSVSRIIKEKGVLDYCEAARIIKAKYPRVRFIMLGAFDKALGGLSREDVRQYEENGIVEFAAEVKDASGFYGKASVYVLASYYREGLPRTILEAMACARPVITTDWPGCREPVVDGKNGFLTEIKNPEMLADRMARFIENPSLVEEMGQRAYAICAEKYEVSIVNRQMREAIEY